MTFNKAKARVIWQLGMIDEVIFTLDVIVLLMSQNIIISILFLLKTINDYITMRRKYLMAYKEERV